MSAILSNVDFHHAAFNSKHICFDFDQNNHILWGYMNPQQVPNFSPEILSEMQAFEAEFVRHDCHFPVPEGLAPVNYYVVGSKFEGIFNLGGDLALFQKLIQDGNRTALVNYGLHCVQNVIRRVQNYQSSNLTTIAMVQGDALGGGFELALSNEIIVAERGVTMGFPEIMFNLFPGMGALSLLSRRVSMSLAKRIVSSGRMYLAEELYDMGVVDILAEKGQAGTAIYDYVKANEKRMNGLMGIQAACRRINDVSADELERINEIWADTALKITSRDLKLMERFVKSQHKRIEASRSNPDVPHLQAVV
jgi:DSF synthase